MKDPATGASAPAPVARRWSDLLPRVLSGLVMAILALGSALLGGPAFGLFWLLASVAVVWEWQHLVGADRAGLRFGVGAATLLAAGVLMGRGAASPALAALLAGLAVMGLVAPGGLRGASMGGLLYAAALVLSVLLLRNSAADGLASVLWLFAVVWGTDVMAYFGGRMLRGPKLWPRLSPGKTWSGFLVGIGAGACLGLLAAPAGTSKAALVVVGLLAGALAQGGDLFESGLKRRHGVKDASRLIPGHGGVMDRVDGFVVASVFAALLGAARMGVDAAGSGVLKW